MKSVVEPAHRTISILGCGRLGLPLARALREAGHRIKGSTTDPARLAEIRSAGAEAFLIRCDPGLHGEQSAVFFDAEILIITIPFRRTFFNPEYYLQQIDAVVKQGVRDSPVRWVIFTGSTAIYPQDSPAGRDDQPLVPDQPRSRVLHKIEQQLLHGKGFDATIVRLAGLYGGSRRIGQFLAEKKNIPDGDLPVNLIHQDDAVRVIVEIIRRDVRNEILNAVSDGHPSRRELYGTAAQKLGLPPPEFSGRSRKTGKIVSNDKLKKILDFRFLHPDPMQDI